MLQTALGVTSIFSGTNLIWFKLNSSGITGSYALTAQRKVKRWIWSHNMLESLLKWGKVGLLSAVAIFAPIHALLLTTGAMIFADLVTGIWAASKRGEPITSAALRRTVTKIFVYESALMLAFLAETYMSDILPFVKMASATITIVEMKSIYENLDEISGNQLLKVIIDKLGSANKQ